MPNVGMTSRFPCLSDSNREDTYERGFLTKRRHRPRDPTRSELPEPEAIRLAQQGDERGFEQIYRLHSQRVYALCLRMMRGNSPEAEHSGIVPAAIPAGGTFRGESAFSTWLHRLAFNIVLMRLRRHSFQVCPWMRCSNLEKRPPGYCTKNTSEAGTCGIAGSLDRMDPANVHSTASAGLPELSSFSTTCRVTSTEKLPLFVGAPWEFEIAIAQGSRAVTTLVTGEQSRKRNTISRRTWNQFWINCQPFDTRGTERKNTPLRSPKRNQDL